jgi:phosphatidylserine/phosphatidylglycerophosphate/cardiolipin synthase-like enzyme
VNEPDADLLAAVVHAAKALPEATVAAFAAGLESADDWSRAGSPAIQAFGPGAGAWQELWRRASTSPWCTPSRLASLLRGAAASEAARRRSESLELAWTGPAPRVSTLRKTEQALLDVINRAQRDLWLVSFSAYRIESVCEALAAATARGCNVRLMLESKGESSGGLTSGGIDAMPAAIRAACACYVWPKEKRPVSRSGDLAKLHAKAAVADGEFLFVGSANLTDYAFDLNIELGVLVRNRSVATVVEQQLRWLVESGTMERLGPA